MSQNGLHISEKVTEIPNILQEYFSPEELFEIFHLEELADKENSDNFPCITKITSDKKWISFKKIHNINLKETS